MFRSLLTLTAAALAAMPAVAQVHGPRATAGQTYRPASGLADGARAIRVPKSLLALSPEAFRAATKVTDDPLEHHASFSTEPAHRERWTWLREDGHDNHLRAVVDKRTGATRFEVRTHVRYWGSQRDFRSAHFATDGGLQSAGLTLTRHGQEFCSNNDLNIQCPLTKTIAFELDEQVVRAIAAGAQPVWPFKLKDDAGSDIRSGIVPAEAAGLLQAVDQYRGGLSRS